MAWAWVFKRRPLIGNRQGFVSLTDAQFSTLVADGAALAVYHQWAFMEPEPTGTPPEEPKPEPQPGDGPAPPEPPQDDPGEPPQDDPAPPDCDDPEQAAKRGPGRPRKAAP